MQVSYGREGMNGEGGGGSEEGGGRREEKGVGGREDR